MPPSASPILLIVLAIAAGCAVRSGPAEPRTEHAAQNAATAPAPGWESKSLPPAEGPKQVAQHPATAPASGPARESSLAVTVPNAPPRMFFSRKDEELLARHGVHYVPVGEGFLVRKTPIDRIFFDEGRVLHDQAFAAIFPAIQRMDPNWLPLDGHQLSDEIIDLLNRLRSIRMLDLRGTNVTFEGLRRLRLKELRALSVPRTLTEAQRHDLQANLPGVDVR